MEMQNEQFRLDRYPEQYNDYLENFVEASKNSSPTFNFGPLMDLIPDQIGRHSIRNEDKLILLTDGSTHLEKETFLEMYKEDGSLVLADYSDELYVFEEEVLMRDCKFASMEYQKANQILRIDLESSIFTTFHNDASEKKTISNELLALFPDFIREQHLDDRVKEELIRYGYARITHDDTLKFSHQNGTILWISETDENAPWILIREKECQSGPQLVRSLVPEEQEQKTGAKYTLAYEQLLYKSTHIGQQVQYVYDIKEYIDYLPDVIGESILTNVDKTQLLLTGIIELDKERLLQLEAWKDRFVILQKLNDNEGIIHKTVVSKNDCSILEPSLKPLEIPIYRFPVEDTTYQLHYALWEKGNAPNQQTLDRVSSSLALLPDKVHGISLTTEGKIDILLNNQFAVMGNTKLSLDRNSGLLISTPIDEPSTKHKSIASIVKEKDCQFIDNRKEQKVGQNITTRKGKDHQELGM